MTNIVGLTPMQDDPAGGRRRLDPSIPLQDGSRMRAPDLRPVAAPVDIYHKAAQAPINNDLQSLAEGLSALNPALARFAAHQAKDDKEIDKDGLAAKYGGMSSADINKVLTSGADPALSNKFASQFVGNIRAQKQADEDAAFLTNDYNTRFDRQNGDWNGEFKEFVAKRATEMFAGNTAGANAYYERMAGFSRGFQDRIIKDKAEQNTFLQQQNTQDGFASIVRQAVDTDSSPQKVMAETAAFMQTNKAVMRLPFKQQQEYLLNAVQPLLNDMEQRPEQRDKIYKAVESILTLPRKGEDGVERRLIDASDGLGEMAQKKLVEFQRKRDELNDKFLTSETAKWKYNASERPELVDPKKLDEWDKANPGALKAGEKESILIAREKALDKAAAQQAEYDAQRKAEAAQGDVDAKNYERFKNYDALTLRDVEVPKKEFYTVGDQSAVKKYTADDQRQKLTDLFERDVQFAQNQRVNSKEMTAEQAQEWADGQRLDKYSGNGMVPTSWKDEMRQGANTLISATQTASKEMPQPAVEAFRRYKLLAARAPNLLSQIADERTRAIFETAMAAEGNETEQLRGALYYYANHTDQTEKVAQKQVTEAVAKMQHDNIGGWIGWLRDRFPGGEVPENLGALNDDIQRRASYLVQAYKLPAELALKKATESLKNHYTVINGWAVPTNDRRVPPNFKTIMENYISKVVIRIGQDELGEVVPTDDKRKAGLQKLGIEDHTDLTLVPMKGGEFQLFDRRNGHPILTSIPVDWKEGSRDGRFLTPDMLQDLSSFARAEEEERALQSGREARERAEIARRSAKAMRQGKEFFKPYLKAPEPFILLNDSPGRPKRKAPAPWLDLSIN